MIRLQILTTLFWIGGQCHFSLWGQNNPPGPPPFNPIPVAPAAPAPFPTPPQAPLDPVQPAAPQAAPGPSVPQAPGLFADGTMEPLELSGVPGLNVEEFRPFVLRKADANSLLDLIQQHTGWNILRTNKDLPAMEISFNSQGHLTKGETIRIVESLLAMHGVSISKISENLYKAVRSEKVNMHVPIWLEGPASMIKPSQKIYMKTFHLNYAPAKDMVTYLTPFKTEVGQLVLLENANSILVTDALINLQRMEQLLEQLDRPISREELGAKFVIWPTKHAGAIELERKLEAMIEGSLKPFLGGTTQVDSDERTGKLLIMTRQENVETIEFVLNELDAPIKMKTTSKHFKLQHAEAKDLVEIIDKIISDQKAIQKEVDKQKAAGRPEVSTTTSKDRNSRLQNSSTLGKAGSSATGSSTRTTIREAKGGDDGGGIADAEGAHEFSAFITISSDERSNAILVYGTPADIIEIGRMIESLDQPLPQARLDTIFVMVDLSEQNQRGIDALLGKLEWSKFARSPRGEALFGEPITETQTIQTPGPDGLPGTADDSPAVITPRKFQNTMQGIVGIPGLNSTIPFQLEDWKLTGLRWDQIFALSSERNDVRIFSTPTLSFAHNSDDVHILIEDERNIIIPTYSGYNSGTEGGNTAEPSSITAKTSLQIKKPKIGMPMIDENGTIVRAGSIYMEIEVKAEKFDETQSNTYQGQSLPAKKIREAKSFLTVRDGEIIVLGGLQEVQVDSTESKYNLLSDIPYFGKKFFRPKSIKYTPTELLIFLKPTIMRPGQNDTPENIRTIDERIRGDYKPKFTSPSGQVLGVPDIDGKIKENSSVKDRPSSRPQL
ncbi:hypothetical protein OAK38_04550 [Verrucomicrobia bacterium]|nr:hypothetical protein [Verrucomicrobiota bacterium]